MFYSLSFKDNSSYNFTSSAGGNEFKFHIKHAMSDDSYYMDIDINRNGSYVPIISCVRLSCGCDLFIPFKRWGLGSMFIVPIDDKYYNKEPTADTLTSKYIMIWEHN